MTRRAAALLLGVLAVAVAALLWLSRPDSSSSGRRRFRLFLRVTPVPVPAVSSATPNPGIPAATSGQTVRVTLFFPGSEDGKLRAEERDIAKPSGGNAFLKSLFSELKRGPQRKELIASLPEKIQLRNAFLLSNGLAVLDLAVDSGLSFGSDEELTIVAALVDTTLQNVADTNRVRILVNGEPAETLGGHVDLTRPLLYLRNEVAP
jgi:spore germination protein GerM